MSTTTPSYRILLATDGHDPAQSTVRLLEAVARRQDAHVTVVSVRTPEEDSRERSSGWGVGHAAWAATVALRRAGFHATSVETFGTPHEEILRIVEEDRSDLVVVGTGNRHWLGHVLLGRVSRRLLHLGASSVLIAHHLPELERERPNVLIGVDSSPHSRFAVETAARFLDPARCRVKVLSVAVSEVPTLFPPGVVYATGAPTKAAEEDLTRPAREAAFEAAELLGQCGFEVEPEVEMGAPAIRLLKAAEALPADLVIVGAGGMGAIDHALLGSVSEAMVRHTRATLVARPRGSR